MITADIIYPGMILQERYQVMFQIGGGGFSQIFEVDDGGMAKVLKILSLERFHNPRIKQKAIALFKREAEILTRLTHPGIPHVEPEGYFTWSVNNSDPLHCLVMEKISGSNLEDWLEARGNEPISTKEAFRWLTQLLNILNELHQQKYFHRDIKPSNCMIRPNGQLVLIDFGAVREVNQSYLEKQKGNETGTVLISPGYTPSEQAEGHAVPQSDFFALGRSFVYLLTGKSPLEFPKDPQTGELIWNNDVTKVSPQLADLVNHLMAPFPGQRPQNCQEVLQYLAVIEKNSRSRLRRFVTKLPGINRLAPRSKILKDSRPYTRLKLLTGLLVLGVSAFLWNALPKIAIADTLNIWGYEHRQAKRLDFALLYYRLALIFDSNNTKVNYNLGGIYEDQNNWDKARIAYKIAARNNFDRAYNNLGRIDILDKKYEKAVTVLQRGLDLANDVSTKYAILKNLGWAYMELGLYLEAETNLQKAIEIRSDRAAAYCLTALVQERQGKKSASIPFWEQCLKYPDEKDPDVKRWKIIAPSNLTTKNTRK